MVSFGSSKSKSQSMSKANFPKAFLDQAYEYFGGEPDYTPKYKGFGSAEDLDKLEGGIYDSQRSKLQDAYNSVVGRQREELSQSGLLNSPAQYIEGGARDVTDKGYLSALQQAARDASLARLGVQEKEAARETGFNVDTATKIYQAFLAKLGLAGDIGRTGATTSTSGGSSAAIFGFGSNGSSAGGD